MAFGDDDRRIGPVSRATMRGRVLPGAMAFCLLVAVAAVAFAPSASSGATVSRPRAGSGLATGVPTSPTATSFGRQPMASTPDGRGYWLVAADGGIFTFGDAGYFGSTGGTRLNAPIVGMASTPDGRGYWLVAADGGIFTFGDAGYFGSTGGTRLNAPIVGMASTPDGRGYWLVAADGGIFTFGDAGYFGSTGGTRLNAPIVGMASTPDGRGYWLVAADGGIFTFGDAGYFGSTGGTRLNAPIVGMASTPDGRGYWLVAADGGIFTFGDAGYFGSEPSAGVAVRNIVGLTKSPDGDGYWIGGRDGRADAFGDAVPLGSRLGQPLNEPIVGFAAESTSSTSTGPLAVASPSLPIALTGASYSASLAASGGTSPYSWSIASGSLPAGLTLSPSGQITGTPNQAGDETFTARVVDSTFPVPQSVSRAVTVAVSAATPTSALSGKLFSTTNWSGYVAGNGPFTSVSGTFSVASLNAGTPNNALLTEWVGIDGWGNSSLIQAGVTQYPDQSQPGTFHIQPWWTVLPKEGVAVNVSGMTVSAGDEVTVNIAQVAGTEWDIQLVDDTNGQSFTTEQTYTGPGASAEWIAEAPVVGGRVTQLAPYNPAIHFTDLRNAPLNTTMLEVEMIQNGNPLPTSTPSTLTPEGFNVAYGANAPPAP